MINEYIKMIIIIILSVDHFLKHTTRQNWREHGLTPQIHSVAGSLPHMFAAVSLKIIIFMMLRCTESWSVSYHEVVAYRVTNILLHNFGLCSETCVLQYVT